MRDRFAEGVANAAIARRSLLEIESRWDISCSVLVDLVSRVSICVCVCCACFFLYIIESYFFFVSSKAPLFIEVMNVDCIRTEANYQAIKQLWLLMICLLLAAVHFVYFFSLVFFFSTRKK